MPDVVTFDPINLRIVEIPNGPDNALDVQEIYGEWKSWLLADPSRMGYPQAFRVIGGDPISPTLNAGVTYFIMNGWRIRPAESNHTLTLSGNLYVETDALGEVDGVGLYPDVPTLGVFQARVRYTVSNLIDQVVSQTDQAVLANILATSQSANTNATIARKLGTNRLEINFTTQRLVLYDDDTVTPLYQWDLDTDGGENMTTHAGVQTKRTPV